MTTPTRLTAEDLPTLRKLETFWSEREAVFLRTRSPLRRLIPGLVARVVIHVNLLFVTYAARAIERTGHLASDERVDQRGRVSRL